ncbi:MAG: SDR family oxidoreductase [Nitrospirae bacterium]|nr:SDR family oxidoreductase [Nitrospirota bacterium]
MNILVTGGCGYIGTILVPRLLDLGHDVTVVDIMWFGNYLAAHKDLKVVNEDTRNIDNVHLDGVDAVIHLANVANDPCGELNAKLSWEVNALATMRLIDKAVHSKVKQFLFACSGSVYGIKEEPQVTEELTLVPVSDYNKTKMVAERVLLSYKDDMIVQSIRPATVCGYSPRMRLDVSVNMLTMQALAKGKITVFGGTQVRPNINIKDIVNIFIFFLENGDKYTGIYNAGFENISILDIAKKVTAFVPAKIIVSESNDPRSYRLNSDKLLSTGFKPQYGVVNAIEEIIKVFREGKLQDEEKYYNLKTMKRLAI